MALQQNNFQTTRNVIASMGGMEGTIEVIAAPEMKRVQDAVPVIKGDGRNRVQFIHDPAKMISPITFEIIIEKERAFALYVRQLFAQHLSNPRSALQLTIKSYDDDGTVVDTATMPNAVIQNVKGPEGDTGRHGEAKVSVTVQPLDWI
jgi:hypothetical protein